MGMGGKGNYQTTSMGMQRSALVEQARSQFSVPAGRSSGVSAGGTGVYGGNAARGAMEMGGDAVGHDNNIESREQLRREYQARYEQQQQQQQARMSANSFAQGTNQNCGNQMTGKSTTRRLAPPGGFSSFSLG